MASNEEKTLLNCTKVSTSYKNNITTTPYTSYETTTNDTIPTTSETPKVEIMVTAIVGLVILIILYASAYRMCCPRKEKYHDTPKKAATHIAKTLFTYVLHIFDTLSDVFLFLHYIAIGQLLKSVLIITFTAIPVLFLSIFCFGKQYEEFKCGDFVRKNGSLQCCFMILWILLVVVFCPFAAILSILVYAQMLALGKSFEKKEYEYLAYYIPFVEATLESAPQLTFQIYLLITDTHMDTTSTNIFRKVSISASALAIAWSFNVVRHYFRQEESFKVKLLLWVSRMTEILPRILLIALVTAEYNAHVVFLIWYRCMLGLVYVCGDRIYSKTSCCDDLNIADLLLGIIGNIFGFSMSDVFKCQKQEKCGGKFFVGYYILFYAENGVLLYIWFTDDPLLVQFKFGGACSNHEWYVPYVFVVVILGSILQPSFLYLYYWLRRKRDTQNENNISERENNGQLSRVSISTVSSNNCYKNKANQSI